MEIDELIGKHLRLRTELAHAYSLLPWETAHIDRLVTELAEIERQLIYPLDKVGLGTTASSNPFFSGATMIQEKCIHKGYAYSDTTTRLEDGRFLARAVITKLDGGLLQPQSQRFLDFETFRSEADARQRSATGAQAWIDAEHAQDKLAMPKFLQTPTG